MFAYDPRDFLSSVWPVHEVDVSGKQLAKMYTTLKEKKEKEKQQARAESSSVSKPKKHRDDLEDGEIDTERESVPRYDAGGRGLDQRRDTDDYYRRDDRRDRDREWDERDARRRHPYENGDRLSFKKVDRRDIVDRGRQPWYHNPSPHRHNPY